VEFGQNLPIYHVFPFKSTTWRFYEHFERKKTLLYNNQVLYMYFPT